VFHGGMLPRFRDDGFEVLGKMSTERRAAKLAELETAPAAAVAATEKTFWDGRPRAYEHTAHAFGYLPSGAAGSRLFDIVPAGSLETDHTLRDGRVTIRLDRLRVAAYPGGGIHRVLFEFDAANHRSDGVDELHFAMTFRAQEGESAAVVGYPIFVGLGVGAAGAAFRCHTINVKNDDDEALLSALESDAVSGGLELLTIAQPAIKPLASLSLGLAKAIAKRHRNVAVQDFYLGLDFGRSSTGARLREGTYFAVQLPEELLAECWTKWAYDAASGQLVSKPDGRAIGYNYVAFSVARYDGR
jgi:hypothetical protein